jgi:hypothetical protein
VKIEAYAEEHKHRRDQSTMLVVVWAGSWSPGLPYPPELQIFFCSIQETQNTHLSFLLFPSSLPTQYFLIIEGIPPLLSIAHIIASTCLIFVGFLP